MSVRFVYLDLASQASIREAAKDIEAQVSALDVLINNAGSQYGSCFSARIYSSLYVLSYGGQRLHGHKRERGDAAWC